MFAVLRATNWYSDLTCWSVQPQGLLHTVLSFVNVTKSPPSRLFVCLTLGMALLLLSWVEPASGQLSQALRTLGQMHIFYCCLLHFLLISGLVAA